MASPQDLIDAATDAQLKARAVALLAATGSRSASGDVETRIGEIVAQAVDTNPDGTTASIASIYRYASDIRERAIAAIPPPPGTNPGAITDDHLRAALRSAGLLEEA